MRSTTIGQTLEHYLKLALTSGGARFDSLMSADLHLACEGLDKDIETLLERTKPAAPPEPVPTPAPIPLLPVTTQEETDLAEPERVGGMEHSVKSWPSSFEDIQTWRKNFDVRINDRNYRAGDILRLREFIPGNHDKSGHFTDRWCRRRIIYVLQGEVARMHGLKPRHCVLDLAEVVE